MLLHFTRNVFLHIRVLSEAFFENKCYEDDVYFLIKSMFVLYTKKIFNTVISMTAHKIFRFHPEVKRFLWMVTFGQVSITPLL